MAKSLKRLPPFKTDVLDLCRAVKRMNAFGEKVEAVTMHYPYPPTASDVEFDKRVAALEEMLDLIVRRLIVSGSKDSSTRESTSNTTVMGRWSHLLRVRCPASMRVLMSIAPRCPK